MTQPFLQAKRPMRLRRRLLLIGLLPMALLALCLALALTATYAQLLNVQFRALTTVQAFRIGEAMVDTRTDTQLRHALQLAVTANPPAVRASLRRDSGELLTVDNGRPLLTDATHRVMVATPYGELTVTSDMRSFQARHATAWWLGVFLACGIALVFMLATCAFEALLIRPLVAIRDRLVRVLRGRPFTDPVRTHLAELDALDICVDEVIALRMHHDERMTEALHIRLRDIARGTRFTARFGDQFRQPLQALGLFIAGMQPGKDLHQRAALSQMRTNVVRMTELLDALMEMTRFDAGIVEPVPTDLIASDLFVRERDLCAAEARRLHVDMHWRGGRLALRGDSALLSDLLHRLVVNAMASAPQGRVLVAARRRGSGVRIEVRDNGMGIDLDQQQRVFEEFVRLPGHAGYGLGLTIARRIAEVVGGRIGVRSRPGAGSTFWFEVDGLHTRNRWRTESSRVRRAS
ncbi:signal transduction histidine kinase [Luteibacter sp. Sphag1AF]|uniref:sensor histidine kinase n=1 Tax=Luteibacter sp. Sphag1AF TaxID=2587031 RepID=UPI00161EE951|nr:HAMP domain-containing sensor histidine kinase [Luteibacter sp. Sphag1AF]MBB3227551.1 signal transduction histidine kinase [Luteibacter sp. Sphag1AF]